MATKEILIPVIGDFTDVDVIEVLVNPGDEISADEPLITVESDKASMEIPSPESGVVKDVRIKVGDKASEGDLILMLEPEHASAAKADSGRAIQSAEITNKIDESAEAVLPSVEPPAGAHPAATDSGSIHAGPSVRRLAREQGIDLTKIQGSGRKGLITKEDIANYLQDREVTQSPVTGTGIPPIPAVDFTGFGEIEEMPLNRIKRLTATNLSRAWLNVPHVTHNDETDITEAEAFRKTLKAEAEKEGVRISLLSFFIRACSTVLKKYPTFNASLAPDGESLLLKKYYHIGIAVDTPNGLVVPVIRDADQKGLFELSSELMELSRRARERKLSPGDMQGASFTISSLGGIGGTSFTPIVNAPEVAILGLTRACMKPVWDGSQFVPRLMQPISLSYDHRVIDGAEAARFVRELGTLMHDIRRLLV